MTDHDLLQEAIAELYSADPEEFTGHREVLVAGARAAGQAAVAKRIAGLRKPTRSAWMVNQLARSDPDLISQLAPLGEELRAAQRSVDGTKIRELSAQRRTLLDALARQAFTASGQHAPAAALRDEVIATLGAALADPEVAEQVAAGSLARVVRREGFGPVTTRALTAVPSPRTERRVTGKALRAPARTPAATSDRAARTRTPAAASDRAARARAASDRAARARAVRERRRKAIAEAEQAVASTEQAFEAAALAEQDQQRAVRRHEEQLADARHRMEDASQVARRAERVLRRARHELDRLRTQPLSIGDPQVR